MEAVVSSLAAACQPLKAAAQSVTFFHSPHVDAWLQDAPFVPVPADVAKYLIALFAAFPLAALFAAIPAEQRVLKHALSLLSGLVLVQFVFAYEWVHIAGLACVVYVVVAATQHSRACVRVRSPILLAVCLLHMSYIHVARMYYDYMGWTLDVNVPLMVAVIKLSSFSYNVDDGMFSRPPAEDASDRVKRVHAERQVRALHALPSPLEYFAWVFNFATVFAGPAFELREYLDTVNRTPQQQAALPPRASYVTARVLSAAACFAVHMAGDKHFHFLMRDAAGAVVLNPAFTSQPTVFHTIGLVTITLLVVKFKYYGVFKLTEGSAVLAGFGYQPPHGKVHHGGWNGVCAIDVTGFELADTLTNCSRAWNKVTRTCGLSAH